MALWKQRSALVGANLNGVQNDSEQFSGKGLPQMSKCPECGSEFPGRSIGSHARKCNVSTEQLFWARVQKGEGCWIFDGCKDKWGYAQFGVHGRRKQAHRLSYELAYGPIPKGKLVMHTCDKPACVNPNHLFLGTDADNMADKTIKGRCWSKLTTDQARAIKHAPEDISSRELAEKYGVTYISIWAIRTGRKWKHI